MEKEKPSKALYKKIQGVQQDVKTVLKSKENTFHHYWYATEQDIIGEIKPLLGKHGLVIISTVLDHKLEYHQKGDKDGQFMAIVSVAFEIIDIATGDSIKAVYPGQGEDKNDKSYPKALTMATKYFLAKTFLVETGDDAEKDKGKKPTAPAKPDPMVEFGKAKKAIASSRNVSGLITFDENIQSGKLFNSSQKAELHKEITARVGVLEK